MAKKAPKEAASSSKITSATSASLFNNSKQVDPALASLFSASTAPKPAKKTREKTPTKSKSSKKAVKVIEADIESDDEVLSSLPSEEEFEESDADEPSIATIAAAVSGDGPSKSRRKRKRDDEELEGRYMQKLEQEEARDDAKREQERESKRPKAEALVDEDVAMANGEDDSNESAEDEREDEEEADQSSDDESEDVTKLDVPKHESLATSGESDEVEKANRTVFLSNVPSEAVSDNSLRKAIRTHMSSFLEALPAEKISHKIESVRFRSVPFSNQLPKKAAFATKAVMTATTKSTNMYIVYTTKAAAREALKLNGTTILNRHIRVDSVAHPAPTQPRRCVFVGNLGFVDDESAIQAANEEEGKSKKQKKREPGDVEEGLWREFGKCGKVESVRVVRDPKTRVGKGFAYVQFTDENAVEAALQYNDKKFPPMLPRKLRVMRAKTIKRNAVKKHEARPASGVYNPKVTPQTKSAMGRAGKLLGRAGAAQMRPGKGTGANSVSGPESFVFEGHRAKSGSYVNGKKKPSGKKKSGRPANRSSNRAVAWKKAGGDKS